MKDSILGPMVEVGAFGGFFFSRIQVHGLAFFERTSGGGIETDPLHLF